MLLNTFDIHINSPNWNGDTPLLVAARRGHCKVVKLLLKKEEIEINQPNVAGDTPLSAAADGRNGSIVNLLLGTEEIRGIGWNGWRPNADAA